MRLRTVAATLFMTAVLSGLSPARMAAQDQRVIEESAQASRERFQEQLRQVPPSLTAVFRLDPMLLTNDAYLAPYPGLKAFLAQHPEVAHNPAFYLGGLGRGSDEPASAQVVRAIDSIMVGIEVTAFFITALFVISWIARSVMEHRRWVKVMSVQTEAHNKLVDRLGANDDLLAYMQSPAGQRFLTSAPMPVEPPARAVAAPVGRILWSVQTGVVLAMAGAGLFVARNNVFYEAAQALGVLATLIVAIGLGFVGSALVSYGISRHLGLLHSPASTHA